MLLLDAGNSRIKWAFAQDGAWSQHGSVATAETATLRTTFADLPPPHRILASNVAGESVAQQLRTSCAAWNCEVEFVTAQAEQCGVRNTYTHPAQLGSDRWAALIAAWQQMRAACLVVNCGTATTIDALSDDGTFIGGLILPGVDMMQRSLAAGTAQLGIVSVNGADGNWAEFPRSTADAIHSGAIQATIGAIRQQYELLGVPKAHCLLGGGAANDIRPHLQLPLLWGNDLVLRGLQLMAQETDKVLNV
jgi:type III pantothenate kinase